jgi:hypothetical protein
MPYETVRRQGSTAAETNAFIMKSVAIVGKPLSASTSRCVKNAEYREKVFVRSWRLQAIMVDSGLSSLCSMIPWANLRNVRIEFGECWIDRLLEVRLAIESTAASTHGVG